MNMKNNIKLVCFDINKTLINENSWLNLNLKMGVTKAEDEVALNLCEEGIITYTEAVDILVRIYKKRGNATRKAIQDTIFKYSYLDSAREVVSYLKAKGYTIVFITGSFDLLVERIAGELKVDHFAANNTLEFSKAGDLVRIIPLGDDAHVKLAHLEQFCTKLGIDMTECACVGDGDNDELMFKKSEHGITFKGSKLAGIAWKTVRTLKEIKDLL